MMNAVPDFEWPANAHVGGECIICGLKCMWGGTKGWIPHTDHYHDVMRERLMLHLTRMLHAAAGEYVPLRNWPGHALVARNRRYW